MGSPSRQLLVKTTAPTRNTSPVRSPTISSPTQKTKMPSPHTSPRIRPQSPLSPRYDTTFDHRLQPHHHHHHHHHHHSRPSSTAAAGNTSRRAHTTTLKLPSLPRFHPANFPSAHSSAQTTPDTSSTGTSPPPLPPISPRGGGSGSSSAHHQRVISDAQKHLLHYQRETVSAAARASTPTSQMGGEGAGPISPRLAPLGSPGPVTPLELEGDEDGYLVAGVRGSTGMDRGGGVPSEELVEKLIREETTRRVQAARPGSR